MRFIRKIISSLMVWAFRLLYHSLAWTYDAVAWVVSAGRWNAWVLHALTQAQGPAVLELGFGPGHLLAAMVARGWSVAGLDESRQMCRQARRRIASIQKQVQAKSDDYSDYTQNISVPLIARGLGEAMPFASGRFNTIIATFPAPYIFSLETLSEIRRVLAADGRLVILLSAEMLPHSLAQRASGWLFRVTGQNSDWGYGFEQRFAAAGLRVSHAWLDGPGARLLYLFATPAAPAD